MGMKNNNIYKVTDQRAHYKCHLTKKKKKKKVININQNQNIRFPLTRHEGSPSRAQIYRLRPLGYCQPTQALSKDLKINFQRASGF